MYSKKYLISSLKNNRLPRYLFMRCCKNVFLISFLFVLLSFSTISHAAQAVIDDVKFQGENDHSESVIFHLNTASLPKAFALKGEKPRVVFDFLGTQLARTLPSVINTDGRMVEKIRMGRHKDKTRVVLDLAPASVVNFDQEFDASRNVLTIHLYSTDYPPKEETAAVEKVEKIEKVETVEVVEVEEAVKAEEVVETTVVITPVEPVIEGEQVSETEDVVDIVPVLDDNPLNHEALLSEVTFENTSNKGEMVLFKLNGFYPPEVSGQETGTPSVTCVFAGTRIGPELIQEQTPQGKFINSILVEQEGDSAPIYVTLQLVPDKNYDLQQVFFKEDNLFVIIVNSYDALATPAQ